LKEGRVLNRLSVVNDGIEAMDFLARRGKYANSPRPDLILLDLNLPRRTVVKCSKRSRPIRIAPHPGDGANHL